MKLKAEIAKRDQLRYIINTEPHGDHWTGNAYFQVPVIAHQGVRARILATDMPQHLARVASFSPDEPKLLEGYTPNVPVLTFQDSMTLHVGDHTFQMIHMPGHTLYQAAILIKEEGVVFTSDNIFYKVQTFIQEANPEQWMEALEALRRLDEEVFVPGHGAVCDKSYLDEQGDYILEWKAYVQKAIDQGMAKEDAIEKLTAMTERYPMDVGLDGQAPRVMRMNVANLYDYLTAAGIHQRG
jgi:cyclase